MQFALNKLVPLRGTQRRRHGARSDEQAGGFGPPLASATSFRLRIQQSLGGVSAVLSQRKLGRAVAAAVMFRIIFVLLEAQLLLLWVTIYFVCV